MLLAASVLTWMIFWMARQSRSVQADLERDVRQASVSGSSWALFSLAFVAVLREGIELALFLTAAALTLPGPAFAASQLETLLGVSPGTHSPAELAELHLASGGDSPPVRFSMPGVIVFSTHGPDATSPRPVPAATHVPAEPSN